MPLPSYTVVDEGTDKLWSQWAECVREHQWTSDDNTVLGLAPRLASTRAVFAQKDDDGSFLGCVIWNEYDEIAFIGFYLVHPSVKGLGIGSVLWKRAIDRMPKDYNIGLRAVPEMAAKYASQDTPHAVSSLNKYDLSCAQVREICSSHPPSSSSSLSIRSISDLTTEQHADLLRFDREVTGRDRSALLDVFFSYDRTAGSCLVDDEGKIRGYAGVTSTSFPSKNWFKLGPVYASSLEDALQLIRPLVDYCESFAADSRVLVKVLSGTVGASELEAVLGGIPPTDEGTTLFSRPFSETINKSMCYVPHNNSGHFDA